VVSLAVLAAVVFAFGLVSRRLEGTILTAPIVFVAAGTALGQSGLVEFHLDGHAVLTLGEIALAIVLFVDAARTDLSALRRDEGLPMRLLGIGMPLTIAIGTGIAALLLTNLTFWEAAIVGTVLAPTDAALGQAVMSDTRVHTRIRRALTVEAGLNDGLSVPFLALFLTLAVAAGELQPATYWIRFALQQVGFGVLVGIGVGSVGGWLVARGSRRGWMTEPFERLALLALAIIAWALADQMGGNGFIATFIGGLVVGPATARGETHALQRSRGPATQPERLLHLRCARLRADRAPDLAGRLLCPAQPDVGPHATRCGLLDRYAPARRLSAVRGLVRAAGAGLIGAGPDRGGRSLPVRGARDDRTSGGANGSLQRAFARDHRRPPLGRVCPPGREDGPRCAGEGGNGRGANPRGYSVDPCSR
jgi:Sodium/hydrogen exchanger family